MFFKKLCYNYYRKLRKSKKIEKVKVINMTKLTQKQALELVLGMNEVKANSELVEKLEQMLGQVVKKSEAKATNKKPTKTQLENEELKETLFVNLESEFLTGAELLEKSGLELSPQKLTALMKQLVDLGKVEKGEKKVDKSKKVAYKLA